MDVKTEAAATHAALDGLLQRYVAMLTRFADGVVALGAISVIVSGNRARAATAAQTMRFAAMDGRIEDLNAPSGKPADPLLVPLVSDNWTKVFGGK